MARTTDRKNDRLRGPRFSREGELSAWASLIIGLVACVYWAPLLQPNLSRWPLVAFVWYQHKWLFCCGELFVPIFGVMLGLDGLRKTSGRTRWLARAGLILSLISELTYLIVIIYFVSHGPFRLGD